MKLAKCSNNHFYDGDKYVVCPHCKENSADRKENGSTMILANRSENNQEDNKVRGDRTVLLRHSENLDYSELRKTNVQEKEIADSGSLLKAVNDVKETVAFEEAKTMAFYNIVETEPVVGWLVCIKGQYIGESFQLKTGRNSIGRSLKMDISLVKEPGISRNGHSIIIYEPKKKKFYIQSGDTAGLTYINDELLMLPCELHSYDKIQMSSSEFLFIAFCCEKFTWDECI